MKTFENLVVWQKAHEFVLRVYQATLSFPSTEQFGLTSQIRRAAVSVPSNIVEGCSRNSDTEFNRFLEISYGSLKELRYQFNLANRLGYLSGDKYNAFDFKLNECEKVLASFIRSLKAKP
jgi:four helix bundle protein